MSYFYIKDVLLASFSVKDCVMVEFLKGQSKVEAMWAVYVNVEEGKNWGERLCQGLKRTTVHTVECLYVCVGQTSSPKT